MKNIFILLIIVLVFTILYGYYQFSNSITKTIQYKEGLTSSNKILPPEVSTSYVDLPQSKSKNYSIATEADFRDFITDIYYIISNGEKNDQSSTNPSVYSNVEINRRAMINISKLSYFLSEIDQVPFKTLTAVLPNTIQTMYDVKELNKMYYAYAVLNSYISTLSTLDDSMDSYYVIYNSLLGYLNAFYDSVVYFNKKGFAAKPQILEVKIGDDINTHYYNKNFISNSVSTNITDTP